MFGFVGSRIVGNGPSTPHREDAKTATFRPPFSGEVTRFGGAERDRTDDLLNAIQALSQLSYSPTGQVR
jgi:hypothetical protein